MHVTVATARSSFDNSAIRYVLPVIVDVSHWPPKTLAAVARAMGLVELYTRSRRRPVYQCTANQAYEKKFRACRPTALVRRAFAASRFDGRQVAIPDCRVVVIRLEAMGFSRILDSLSSAHRMHDFAEFRQPNFKHVDRCCDESFRSRILKIFQ